MRQGPPVRGLEGRRPRRPQGEFVHKERTARIVLLLLALLCTAGHLLAETADADVYRTWRSRKGSEIEARLASESAGVVTLVTKDGDKIVISRIDLSSADREYLQTRRKQIFESRLGQRKPARRTAGSKAPRGVKADYLTEMERAVIDEMNLARRDPAAYATFVEQFRAQHLEGTIFNVDGVRLRTEEGLPAVDEAIAFLKKARRVGVLRPVEGLSKAADDHAKDLGPKGMVGHTGSDGSTTAQRVSRRGRWLKTVGENISFGCRDARRIVVQLIIDDGVPDRGHRENMYNGDFGVVGVAIAPHTTYGTCCVIDYAGGFIGR